MFVYDLHGDAVRLSVCVSVPQLWHTACLPLSLSCFSAAVPTGSATYIMNFMHKAECQHWCIIFCSKMLNVTKHQAPFQPTATHVSPEDALAAGSRHASRHTRAERPQLYSAQLWQERQSRRQERLGDKEGNESRVEGEGSETRWLLFAFVCTDAFVKEAKREKQYHNLMNDLML